MRGSTFGASTACAGAAAELAQADRGAGHVGRALGALLIVCGVARPAEVAAEPVAAARPETAWISLGVHGRMLVPYLPVPVPAVRLQLRTERFEVSPEVCSMLAYSEASLGASVRFGARVRIGARAAAFTAFYSHGTALELAGQVDTGSLYLELGIRRISDVGIDDNRESSYAGMFAFGWIPWGRR